jgi:hypothetical protein
MAHQLLENLLNVGVVFLIIMVASIAGNHDMSTCEGRDWWIFPKQHTEWTVIHQQVWKLTPAILDREWRRHYRMSYETYLELVETLIPYVQHDDTRLREAIPGDKAVAMVLYRLAPGMAPLAVAEKFEVGKSTIIKYTDLITEALANLDKLARRYINIPLGQRLRKIIADFRDGTGLDNIVGAIDGSHIKLFRQPPTAAIPG